jgi:hypothetical protein
MIRVKLFATALALAVLAVLAGRATAQNLNTQERSFLTFSTAVELPGVVLQPGTYVFKLADTGSRNVVQVWNEKENHMIGHWTFVQADRREAADETIVMFKETRAGATPAVQYWYFPGERIGKEFLYPKDQAERIASRTGADVRIDETLVADVSVPAPEPAAEIAVVEPEPVAPVAVAEAPAPAPEPEPAAVVEESQVAAVEPAPAPAPVESAPRAVGTSGQSDELPRTASPLALTGLLGLFSLFGAAGIRAFRT